MEANESKNSDLQEVVPLEQDKVAVLSDPLKSEQQYISKTPLNHRKLFGQFFTPVELSHSMAKWINQCNPLEVLDPAVGTGVLLKAVQALNPTAKLTGWDIDGNPLVYAKKDLGNTRNVRLIQGDFLEKLSSKKYDAITANPPYVRHHKFNYDFDKFSFLEGTIGKIPKTANLYVLFIAAILDSLKPGGRAAILIPSDWLNSNFGASLKSAFQNLGIIRRIVYFPNNTMPFSDNLSTAVILFIENSKSENLIELIQIKSDNSRELLSTLGNKELESEFSDQVRKLNLNELDPKDKWGSIFEGKTSEVPKGWISVNSIAKTKRGIATGANNYFLISESEIKVHSLNKRRTRKCVGRAKDVKGLIFSNDDFSRLEKSNAPTRLLDLDQEFEEDQNYIQLGVLQELPSRFLLSNRDPWYSQENREPAPIWVGVFGREGIRFIWNNAGVSNLTTFHCLYPVLSKNECGVLVAMLNSSVLQKWNSRTERSYGGGLQKVEPRDILQMHIPDPRKLSTSVQDQLLAALVDSDALHKGGSGNWRMPLDQIMDLIP